MRTDAGPAPAFPTTGHFPFVTVEGTGVYEIPVGPVHAGLIEPGHLTWPEVIRKLTINPAQLLGIPKGTLRPGADADVSIIDPEARWTIDPALFHSRSRNTPYGGWDVRGRAHTVIVAGEVRYTLGGIVQQAGPRGRT